MLYQFRRSVIVALAALFFSALALPGLSHAKGEVMYVDIERVLATSKAGQEANRRMRNLREQLNEELVEKGQALQKEREDLERQRSVMAEDAFAREQEKLTEKENALRSEAFTRNQQAQQTVQRSYENIERALNDIMMEILEKQKLSGIFTRRSLLVAAPENDLTSEILAELDKRLPRLPAQ